MQTIKAEFIIAAHRKEQFPTRDLPELAIVGRSNVGKSSMINALLGNKRLAKVSATPGRTQSINFFVVNQNWMFVDLPGYGFAKVPKEVQRSWQGLIESYLIGRVPLQGIILIVDIRREPQESDMQMLDFLQAHEIPVLIVATKADKLSKNQADRAISALADGMQVERKTVIRFSSLTGQGRDELWREIYALMSEGETRMREHRKTREFENRSKKGVIGEGIEGTVPTDVRAPVVVANEDGSW